MTMQTAQIAKSGIGEWQTVADTDGVPVRDCDLAEVFEAPVSHVTRAEVPDWTSPESGWPTGGDVVRVDMQGNGNDLYYLVRDGQAT
jgi:hypothetical protein